MCLAQLVRQEQEKALSEQLEEKVEVDEKELHCDGHAGADGPHHDAKEETR